MASSTGAREALRTDWLWLLTLVLACAITAVTVSLILRPFPPSPREVALCDQAVAAMLDGRDLVELQRADLILRHLECRVRRRVAALP